MQRISSNCQRWLSWVISRSSRPQVFFKRDAFENFAKFTGNPPELESFLHKVVVLHPVTLYKTKQNSSTEVFLWILRNFQEQVRTAAWLFTILRDVSHYAFLSVGFFNKTLLMKIFGDICHASSKRIRMKIN